MTQKNGIAWHAKTDIGLKRKTNEDRIFLTDLSNSEIDTDSHGIMFAVADGMGGHAGGEIASRMACEGLMDYYSACNTGKEKPLSVKELCATLVKTIFDIDTMVRVRAKQDAAIRDMGTTLSVLLIVDTEVIIGHVGDSRIYRQRGEQLKQLTLDNTFVQEMVTDGELKPEDASRHPLRNVLTRAVGTMEPLDEVFTSIEDLVPGDFFLLCSDGLHDMISPDIILKTLHTLHDPVEAADRLVELALANGGNDNVTVIVIRT